MKGKAYCPPGSKPKGKQDRAGHMYSSPRTPDKSATKKSGSKRR